MPSHPIAHACMNYTLLNLVPLVVQVKTRASRLAIPSFLSIVLIVAIGSNGRVTTSPPPPT